MRSINDNLSARSTGNNPNLRSISTYRKRDQQNATSTLYQAVYKNPELETQAQEIVDTHEHAIPISDKRPSQDLVRKNDEAQPHLASHKLLAAMREMARE